MAGLGGAVGLPGAGDRESHSAPSARPAMAYGNLIRELAVTDFKLRYQGSILGYAWSFFKPLLLFLVLLFVFARVLRLGSNVPNYPLQLLIGIVLWTYFADATSRAMGSITERADLIRKVYFPRVIIVVAASVSSLITLLFNFTVVILFMLVARVGLQLTAPLFLLVLVELYVLTLGTSLILAALYVRFRDFRHIWEVGLNVLFYTSPIIYTFAFIQNPIHRRLAILNPVAQIVADSRRLLIDSQTQTAADLLPYPLVLVPYALAVMVLVVGWYYFKRAAAAFAEEI